MNNFYFIKFCLKSIKVEQSKTIMQFLVLNASIRLCTLAAQAAGNSPIVNAHLILLTTKVLFSWRCRWVELHYTMLRESWICNFFDEGSTDSLFVVWLFWQLVICIFDCSYLLFYWICKWLQSKVDCES